MIRFTFATAKRSMRVQCRVFVAVAALCVATQAAQATTAGPNCVLPVPDGSDTLPSKANAEGRIVRVGRGFIEVARRFERPMHVSYGSKTEFYSAFGGDYDPSELAPGLHVAVWFVGCKPLNDGVGQAAYLQLYSKDPADQPPG